MILREAFDYRFSRLDPTGPHIDPPHVAIYDVLMVKGPDHRARASLARSWRVGEDGLEWRLRLEPDVSFHSGAVCDAEAVVASLTHLRHADPSGQLWYWDPVDRVYAEGRDTVVFRLHHPYVRLPSLLWGMHTAIHNESLRTERPGEFGISVADGTGPFRLVSWSPDRVVAERFEDFYGGRPSLDGIEWKAILAERERLDALDAGEVDVIHGPPPADVDALRDDRRFVVVEFPQASTFFLALDWRRRDLGFDDLRVREAISLAIDREEIVRHAFAGRGAPVWGPVPPGDEHYDAEVDRGRVHDPRRAVDLLREVRGAEVLAFECVVQDDEVFRRVTEALVPQLADVGVHLDVRFVEPFGPFYSAVDAGPPASLSKWLWQDAVDALIGFSSTRYRGSSNTQHASVPELDAAFSAWLRAADDRELSEAAGRVARIAAATLPYIPIATPNDVWVHSARLKGFRPYQADLYPRYGDATFAARSMSAASREAPRSEPRRRGA